MYCIWYKDDYNSNICKCDLSHILFCVLVISKTKNKICNLELKIQNRIKETDKDIKSKGNVTAFNISHQNTKEEITGKTWIDFISMIPKILFDEWTG